MKDHENKPKKIIRFKRDNGVVILFASNALVPAIKKGALIGSDQVSSDGKNWFRLDKHPQLTHLFTTQPKTRMSSVKSEPSAAFENKPDSPLINKNNYRINRDDSSSSNSSR